MSPHLTAVLQAPNAPATMEDLKRRYVNVMDRSISAKAVMSEIIGVFGFVLMGTGAAALCNAPEIYSPESPRMVKEAIIGFAFGIGILCMIYATAHNNAGQLNPAVTIGLVCSGNCPAPQAALNIAGQVYGAIMASGILKALLPASIRTSSGLGANSLPGDQTIGRAFLGAPLSFFLLSTTILSINSL
jgi:glycerol uptake facilitator-like aquaporin